MSRSTRGHRMTGWVRLLSSFALSWVFSGGKEWLTPVVLRTPSVNHSFPANELTILFNSNIISIS